MGIFIEFREKIKALYGKYSVYILPVIKFVFAICVFMVINKTIGYFSILKNPFVLVILSLICAVMPFETIVILSGAMVLGHCFALGYETAGFALILILILLIFLLRFSAGSMLAVILMPLAFALQVPLLVPLAFGLLGGSSACLSVASGTAIYYFLHFVSTNADALKYTALADVPKKLTLLLDGLIKDPAMLLAVIVCAVTTLIVYMIRRMSIRFAWQISICLGMGVYVLLIMAGSFFLKTDASLLMVLVGSAVSLLFGFAICFFCFHVDYAKTEHLQFEDDEYYYYVKAIPKVSVKMQNDGYSQPMAYQGNEEMQDPVYEDFSYGNPGMHVKMDETSEEMPKMDEKNYEQVDFESRLEDSLKDL